MSDIGIKRQVNYKPVMQKIFSMSYEVKTIPKFEKELKRLVIKELQGYRNLNERIVQNEINESLII